MRVDTTVVETNIHYPTDGTLLGDGVRVLTRTMKRDHRTGQRGGRQAARSHEEYAPLPGADRSRQPQPHRAGQGALAAVLPHGCWPSPGAWSDRPSASRARCATGIKGSACLITQAAIEGHRDYLETMVPRVQQVMRQTRERILHGNTRAPGKLVSLFEPHTEIIRKGKAAKPTEFGKMVKIQEAEQQIVTHYEVYDERPSDADLLVPAIDVHAAAVRPSAAVGHRRRRASSRRATKPPRTNAASSASRSPTSAPRAPSASKLHKKRWFRNAQKWRTGCEGRISLLKRRHGLNRCRYKGAAGMKRWVGLGVIADNLINIAHAMASPATR